MGQQEYDNFKRLVREWLDSHPKEYASFVEEMNDKEFKGFFKVFKVATALAPKYREAARKRTLNDRATDFEELENILQGSDLAGKLVNEFHNPNRKSIIPAMLAWLYYGRSYECMVEQGEELAKRKDISGLYKWLVSCMVKFIVRKSISSGMRTKEDWLAFRKQQKAIAARTAQECRTKSRHTYPAGAADREQGCHSGKNRNKAENTYDRNGHRTHVHRTGGIPLHALLSHKDFPERTAAAIHRPQHRTRKGNTESVQEPYLTFRRQQKTDKGHR